MNNAKVITVKCEKTKKLYGVRMEEVSRNNWVGNWAFPIKESQAKMEKYDREKMSGTFSLDAEYPGCPHCGAMGIFKCSYCGTLNGHDGASHVTCAQCGKDADIGGNITEMSGGGM